MLNILESCIGKSLPDGLETRKGLEDKVDANGDFRPFRGNTMVFLLDEHTKQELAKLQKTLHDAAGYMLAKKLDPSTFHMTLHDLENVANADRGDTRPLDVRMERAKNKVKPLLEQWGNHPPLKMQASHLFNMVDTSVVLVLKPADEESWQRLDALYCALEAVKPLGYALTPHITMAYYRPGIYSSFETEPLQKLLTSVEQKLEVELRMEDLVLQFFTDMNHYWDPMEKSLERFKKAQEGSYETALYEIRCGKKQSHWIWYIFPQIDGLGYSSTARYYAIQGRAEAEAYWNDRLLSKRLVEITRSLLAQDAPIEQIMGYPDNLKLRSSMTLFYRISGETLFRDVLDKFFKGKMDESTVWKLEQV